MHTGKPRAFLLEFDIFLAIVKGPSGNGWSVGAVVAQYLDMVEVTGSNPVQTTIFTLKFKVLRAFALQMYCASARRI